MSSKVFILPKFASSVTLLLELVFEVFFVSSSCKHYMVVDNCATDYFFLLFRDLLEPLPATRDLRR